MPLLGFLYYIISFFCFFMSIFYIIYLKEDASLPSKILVFYIGFCVLWLGWWFKRATCAHFGMFFSNDFEFEDISNYLKEKTNGNSHKFLWQFFILAILGYIIYYIG